MFRPTSGCPFFAPFLLERCFIYTHPHPIVRPDHRQQKSLMAVEKWLEGASSGAGSSANDGITSRDGAADKSMTYIYGGFGGRFDQEMGVVNALFVWGKRGAFQRTILAVYDEQTCAFVLPESPTKSEIRITFPGGVSPLSSEEEEVNHQRTTCRVGEGPTCGLIPIVGRCERVVTTGLRWNLDGSVPLEFGGLVSSSNRVVDDLVTVDTSSPMLFTAEIILRHG